MTISIIQSRLRTVQREIQTLSERLTTETRKEAETTGRILRAKQAISNTSSQSTAISRLREIERYEREIGQIQQRKASLTKQVADKTRRLHELQQTLSKEQEQEHKKALDMLKKQQREAQRERTTLLQQMAKAATPHERPGMASAEFYDAFISHASKDKQDLVRPLADRLTAEGFAI